MSYHSIDGKGAEIVGRLLGLDAAAAFAELRERNDGGYRISALASSRIVEVEVRNTADDDVRTPLDFDRHDVFPAARFKTVHTCRNGEITAVFKWVSDPDGFDRGEIGVELPADHTYRVGLARDVLLSELLAQKDA